MQNHIQNMPKNVKNICALEMILILRLQVDWIDFPI